MVKTYELRSKDEKALAEDLAKLKAELAKARIGKVAAAATQVKASKIGVRIFFVMDRSCRLLERTSQRF